MAAITTSPKTRRHRRRIASGGPSVEPSVEPIDVTAKARGLADFSDHERVFEVRHPAAGLHAIIAIHDTTLGPALGGCRMWPYASATGAMRDALRLSRGMTFKSALAGLELGGGKAVVIGDPKTGKSGALFRAFGSVVEGLRGSYITGEDLGTSVEDMDWVGERTSHVIGTTRRGGDPSPMTALGVCEGIKAAVKFRLASDTLAGVKVAVQGLGHVGYALCQRLAGEGARLVVADIDAERVTRATEEFDATALAPEKIHAADADVFAPCAFGAVLNDDSIPELRCAIIGGSANNQLENEKHGEALRARGLLYAPDYVINAGGLISGSMELAGEDPRGAKAWALVCQIGATLGEIFTRAEADGVAPSVIADRIAVERIADAVGGLASRVRGSRG